MQALHTAATGMAAQELSVQVISNNIANLQTTGYKKQTAEFQDLIYQHISRVGAQAVSLTFVTGSLSRVGSSLALALRRAPLRDAQGPWDTHLRRALLLSRGYKVPRLMRTARLAYEAAGIPSNMRTVVRNVERLERGRH